MDNFYLELEKYGSQLLTAWEKATAIFSMKKLDDCYLEHQTIA